MRKLLNTLYVTTPETYLALDGENVVVLLNGVEKLRLPLHTIESIAYFGYKGTSPALIGACAERGIRLSYFSPNGRFLAATTANENGNVLLRKQQYRLSDDPIASAKIARSFILAKVHNSRWILERTTRDHPQRVDVPAIKKSCQALVEQTKSIAVCENLETLRGLEGSASERYFSHFDQMILVEDDRFHFENRNRRPPMDRVNAMLSFLYALLSNTCAAALEQAGLDPYVGFLHRDRPGRCSLALDLMEEFRGLFCDRLALTMINTRAISVKEFDCKENGAVLLNDSGRKAVINAWQSRKQEQIVHPFLAEKIPWGLVPHIQAVLLARYLRGDLDAYPPFFWK
ncbi:MAG: type I-C CRISPR-associated endonuclease Cas1c [Clostridia bacterium]